MLTLVAGIVATKWMQRKTAVLADSGLSRNDSAIQTLQQLKIGSRFSDLTLSQLAKDKRTNSFNSI